ncbi:tyrosine--tRNA ligase [Desulfobotulus sp. H1]|uniref:Tyrosine--tRNA ligase n=1 Tax=Desulfobotulus pelophilus TaxID=2823377 RepID=A0ABT3NCA5_9BACT|nr:tyrosine--tRNA ligase [Desulfobotulus pelophilus]MCW7755105.1 tyrosine--tRNA ligase [Desulfobotulus pelophilus]
MHALDVLRSRGFIESTTHEEELASYLSSPGRYCYIGFDPTGSSLHVGHLVTVMALSHMQRCGHRPIALVGGGTGMIGDPSGKTEMRQLMTPEIVAENKAGLKGQLSSFLDFSDGKALLVDNADWLSGLHYIPFLRDVGSHFSVNRMIKAESYRARLESEEGLSFIEFNYMLLQAYDFYVLAEKYGCLLQMGGRDQWGNIVAGVELVRRKAQKTVFGITFPLIMTSSGIKMGKTHAGAVWLDPERTSPYDYYQFWVNTDDADVVRFLKLFTFLPMEEIEEASALSGRDLNGVKAVLAYEATAIVHGSEAAAQAHRAASAMFGGREVPEALFSSSQISRSTEVDGDGMPSTQIPIGELAVGISAVDLFCRVGLCASRGAARRLIEQGGAYVNGQRVEGLDAVVVASGSDASGLVLRSGKKHYHRIEAV